MKRTTVILFALICLLTAQFGWAYSTSIGQQQWWTVNPGSPSVSKITVTRHYQLDANKNHPQERAVSAWFAPDSTCLAWSYVWKYEPRKYGTNEYEPLKIETDTTQADFSGTPLYNPMVERPYLKGFELYHYTSDKEQPDKYGNWKIAYTNEFHHNGEYIERNIEYVGEESAATKAEIDNFLDIRNNGRQNPNDALSFTERMRLGIESASFKFVGFMSIFLCMIGALCGLIYWCRYAKWRKIFHQLGTVKYNKYSPFIWILSAVSMYCLASGISGLLSLSTSTIYISGLIRIAFGAFIYFRVFPGLAKMLNYDRAIGRWGSLILLIFNLLALYAVLYNALGILNPVISFIAALIITFFTAYGYIWDQAYKCPECHGYENTKYLGVSDGGVKSENYQNEKEDFDISGPYYERTTTKTHRTDYYRRDVHKFMCPECKTIWHRTLRGSYIGTHKKIKKETERMPIE